MLVRQIFEPKLAQYAYLVGCPATGEALIIDPLRDVDQYFDLAESKDLRLVAAADTHIHADYLTGLREMAEHGLKVYASDEGGEDWRYEWLRGSEYEHKLIKDGDTFMVGNIRIEAVHTPGHTPEHMSYLVTDLGGGADEPIAIATGDFVFVGDLGRPDLLETAAGQQGTMQEGAKVLFDSVQRFKKMKPFLQVWPAHGAGSACGKALGDIPVSTVGYELRYNASIEASESEERFVNFILQGQPEPPMYFARMKKENRSGPAVLGGLRQPRRLTVAELGDLAGRTTVAVLDTRPDRSAFMKQHLPGALYAPIDNTFPTVAGSYVEAKMPIYLLIEHEKLDEAVRDLARVGLDNVAGYATPDTFARYVDEGGETAAIEEISFEEMQRLRDAAGMLVLDVRGKSEYDAGHVPGAMQLAHTRLLADQDAVPEGKTLLVHCRSGARAAVASALLARLGHDVQYVSDQFSHWAEIGEMETEEEMAA